MHPIRSCTFLLAVLANVYAVLLVNSGVYTITISGRAITQASAGGAITAELSSGTGQSWTVVVNQTLATVQNAVTRSFLSTDGVSSIVGSTTSFTWSIVQFNGQNIFCAGGGLCIALVSGTNTLALTQTSAPGDPSQLFAASATSPPRGFYQIQNLASNSIFGNPFVPAAAFPASFPAVDRSEIWTVIPIGNGSTISFNNLDTGGWLAVSSNGTVGAFSTSSPVPWTVGFQEGKGQVISPASGGFLTTRGVGTSLTIGNVVDQTSTWVFQPVDANRFLPRTRRNA